MTSLIASKALVSLILVVVSSSNSLPLKNGGNYATGYYLNELTVPAKKLVEQGYRLVFADPNGNTPSMDVTSDNAKYFGGSEEKRKAIRDFHDNDPSMKGLKHPVSLARILAGGLDRYAGIFIPGGHAPMNDLMESPELGQILRYFHQADKPTALICHGPIALASSVEDTAAFKSALIAGDTAAAEAASADWIYGGYQMTIFSDAEESVAQAKMGGMPLFSVEAALRTAGGAVDVAASWTSHVVRDRELITGQNPFSDDALADALIQALGERN